MSDLDLIRRNVECLRSWTEREVSQSTQGAVDALHCAGDKLAEAADEIERLQNADRR